jgi:hypothetical protein
MVNAVAAHEPLNIAWFNVGSPDQAGRTSSFDALGSRVGK